jgi:hypothetical protein
MTTGAATPTARPARAPFGVQPLGCRTIGRQFSAPFGVQPSGSRTIGCQFLISLL